MTEQPDRRPLASRDTGWAKATARRLARTGITPNQISMASMAAALLAALAFVAAGQAEGVVRALFLLLAAAFCQLRLLCNLFDGMVAIEGGKKAADGPFWNEFPDRVADILILAGAGYAVCDPALGWSAAALAVFTAYVRELGRATGLPSDFSGPMAKQHRMAVMTGAAVLSLAEPLWNGKDSVITIALWVVAVGSGATVLRRSARLIAGLKARSAD